MCCFNLLNALPFVTNSDYICSPESDSFFLLSFRRSRFAHDKRVNPLATFPGGARDVKAHRRASLLSVLLPTFDIFLTVAAKNINDSCKCTIYFLYKKSLRM